MRLMTLATHAICLAGIATACTPATIPSPSPAPDKPQVSGPTQPATRYLHFSPNIYQYQFQQAAQITADGSPDTVPSTITTRARILVTVATRANSDVEVSISFDSISMNTEGLVPSRGFSQVTSLDSVLQGVFSTSATRVEPRLGDSLCAYSQFITAARELLLPELLRQVEIPGREVYVDSITQKACRSGIAIELTTVRELRDLSRNPPEFAIQQRTNVAGSGQPQRDSITVSGSILTRGVAIFGNTNRLPSLVQTESEGTITVQLGSITTVFRQTSRQEIRLSGITAP